MNAHASTARMILDALSFANVSTLGEFRALLRQVDRPAEPDARDATPPSSGTTVIVPAIPRVQGAM